VQLDARVRAFQTETIQALQQQPAGKDQFDSQPDLGFPAGRQTARGSFQAAGFLQQVARGDIAARRWA